MLKRSQLNAIKMNKILILTGMFQSGNYSRWQVTMNEEIKSTIKSWQRKWFSSSLNVEHVKSNWFRQNSQQPIFFSHSFSEIHWANKSVNRINRGENETHIQRKVRCFLCVIYFILFGSIWFFLISLFSQKRIGFTTTIGSIEVWNRKK